MLIAIVEDDKEIRELVALHLTRSNFLVQKFSFGSELLKFLEKGQIPALVILDIMLPDYDGFELLKYLKDHSKFREIPIIMLTARSDETDRVLGLELGADDYVVKPFSPRELVSRVKAVLRRSEKSEINILSLGNELYIDLDKEKVTVEGEEIKLTATEYEILALLASNPGSLVTKEKIYASIWTYNSEGSERTVDVHITNLRRKLKDAGKYIKNVRGRGYRIEVSI